MKIHSVLSVLGLVLSPAIYASDYVGEATWGNRQIGYGCGDAQVIAMDKMTAALGGDLIRDYAIRWEYTGMIEGKKIVCRTSFEPNAAAETFGANRKQFAFTDTRSATGKTPADACARAEASLVHWSIYKITTAAGSGYDPEVTYKLTHSALLDREIDSDADRGGNASCKVTRRFVAAMIYYKGEYATAEGTGATAAEACKAADAFAETEAAKICGPRDLVLNHWWTTGERTKETGGKVVCRTDFRSDCLEKGGQ